MKESLPKIKNTETLTNKAYQVIKDAIIKNQIKPEEPIYEQELAETLGISRTPVRSALEKLKTENLLKTQGNQLIVSDLSREDLEVLFEIRSRLEPYGCKLAAQFIKEEELKTLESTILLQENTIADQDLNQFLHQEYTFHFTIAQATGNGYLSDILENIIVQVNRYIVIFGGYFKSAPEALEEHRRIYTELSEGDPEKAELEMKRHIDNARKRIL